MKFRVTSTSGWKYEHPLITWYEGDDWGNGEAEVTTLEQLMEIAKLGASEHGKGIVVLFDLFGDGVPTLEIYDTYRE